LLASLLSAGLAAIACRATCDWSGWSIKCRQQRALGIADFVIAQGSIFLIYEPGSDLLPTANASVTSTSVTVGSTAVDAFLIYTSPTQVAAVLPSQTPVGAGQSSVTYQGATSTFEPVQIVVRHFYTEPGRQRTRGSAELCFWHSPPGKYADHAGNAWAIADPIGHRPRPG